MHICAGKKVVLAGNIGKPALDLLFHPEPVEGSRLNQKTLVILELSSFQLQDLTMSPRIAAVLDVFPEHLDVHKTPREYLSAKTAITRRQKKTDAVFYFADNAASTRIARKSAGRKIGLRIVSPPLRNQIMAAAMARYLGVRKPIIAAVIKSFRGLPHRLELVRRLTVRPLEMPQGGRAHGKNRLRIDFYNDSAATNPHATAFALAHFKKPLALIAGGKDKGLNYAPLARAIRRNPHMKAIILMGENRKKIARALHARTGIKNSGLKIMEAKSLRSAVKAAYGFTRKTLLHPSSFIILFSPAAASFDMFRDYEDRGNQFKKMVALLTANV